jgi:integrase/recombinase XerC
VTAREALQQWLAHLAQERRASPRTVEAYGFAASRYIAFLERHRGETLALGDLATLTAGEIRAWLAHLRQGDRPLSPRSLSHAGSTPPTRPSPWCAGPA